MDEKWIEGELGKLANSSVSMPADLDSKTRTRIREASSRKMGSSIGMKLKAIRILPVSALLMIFAFFATMAFLSLSGPAGGGELALGKYETEDGFAWVELKEDNRFEFCRNIATSYWPGGDYSIQEGELVLSVAENEQYRFSIVGDTIVFQGGEYAESLIAKGTVFSLSGEQDYIALDQLPDPYPMQLAVSNGDVVEGHNLEKLGRFIENVKANLSDRVRVTNYTIEGDAIIQDLQHDKGKLTLIIDCTRDKYGARAINEYDLIDVYMEEKNEMLYYLAKTTSGKEIALAYAGRQPAPSLPKVIDIKPVKTNKGHQFSVQTRGEFDSVSLIYAQSGSGEIEVAHVLSGDKATDDQFTIDFDFSQVNGNARVLAFKDDVGVVAGNSRLTDDWAQQDYTVLPNQGGQIPQILDMSIVVDGKRSAIVADDAYSLGNEVFFDLSVSADATLVEYVFFPDDDPTLALIFPAIEGEQGGYRIEFNNDKPGHGYFLFYNLAGENNVVVRSGHHSVQAANLEAPGGEE